MNQAFRFVHNLVSSRHTVDGLGKVLALSIYPVPKAPLIWSKKKIIIYILKACQQDEQPKLYLNFIIDIVSNNRNS